MVTGDIAIFMIFDLIPRQFYRWVEEFLGLLWSVVLYLEDHVEHRIPINVLR